MHAHEPPHPPRFLLPAAARCPPPGSLYSTFVIEQRHGFNKQTPGLFASDLLKSLLLLALLVPPVVGGLTYILVVSGPLVPLYLWSFILCLSLLLLTIYPTLIAPLFNKFEPLPEVSGLEV